jgi:hypothetical protein
MRMSLSAAGSELAKNSFGGSMSGLGSVAFWTGAPATPDDAAHGIDVFLRG